MASFDAEFAEVFSSNAASQPDKSTEAARPRSKSADCLFEPLFYSYLWLA
jgi:hypothetical protein